MGSLEEGPEAKMSGSDVQFYIHPQSTALNTFLPLLHPHLPTSNPLYNRLQAPHNIPSRHCLFAATFPPTISSTSPPSEPYTILFSDRSRHHESQIWTFNTLCTLPTLSSAQQNTLTVHIESAIYFLKNTPIPEAPGWPFSPILRFASNHVFISNSLLKLGEARDAVRRKTRWNLWLVSTSSISSRRSIPEGFTVARVPEDQLDIVLSTSSIPRQPSTMLMLPSVGLLNQDGKLVAWGYVGIDGSFATLYVLPEYRGKGLASVVAVELLSRLDRGEFGDMGYGGKSWWVHSDVYAGNGGSEGVMKSLGGYVGWESTYIWIDSEKF
jgi:hypothetical protein